MDKIGDYHILQQIILALLNGILIMSRGSLIPDTLFDRCIFIIEKAGMALTIPAHYLLFFLYIIIADIPDTNPFAIAFFP